VTRTCSRAHQNNFTKLIFFKSPNCPYHLHISLPGATTRQVNSLIITTTLINNSFTSKPSLRKPTLQLELAESNPDPEPELQFLPHAARVPPAIPELTHPSALPNPRSGEHDERLHRLDGIPTLGRYEGIVRVLDSVA
jgi:hypothetical protein